MPRERVINQYIEIDVALCEGCGRCVVACKNDALEVARGKRGACVHIARPKRCTGCLSCVAACREDAIRPVSSRDE